MDNRGNAQNPANTLGVNEYAGFVAPSRPDASTLAPGGNTVDPRAIPKTLNVLDKTETQAKPLGHSSSSGY